MRKFTFALILILTLTTLSSAQFVNESKVDIKAVAVTSGENPRGVVINISVIVVPGDGKVFVSTTPYTAVSYTHLTLPTKA